MLPTLITVIVNLMPPCGGGFPDTSAVVGFLGKYLFLVLLNPEIIQVSFISFIFLILDANTSVLSNTIDFF